MRRDENKNKIVYDEIKRLRALTSMSLSGALAPFHSCGALGPAADDNAFITDSLAAQRPARDAAGWGARLPLTLEYVCVCVCVCV